MEKANGIRTELLDELLVGVSTQEDMFGPQGLLKRLTGKLVERALKAELAHHLEQDDQAANRSNGTSSKTLLTEHGPVGIDVARDRAGTFEPVLLPKHAKRVKGLDEKILALYARGMSVRDIQAHLAELYHAEISPELVSRVTEAVREEIVEWQSRPIEACYAVIWLDALMVKIRDGGVVQNKAVYVAIGLRLDGHKELLGLWIEQTEGAKFWQRVLSELQARGLRDVLIACCDGLKGLPQAIAAIYPQTTVQTCIVHQVRYSLSFATWKDRKSLVAALRRIYTAATEEAAVLALDQLAASWSHRYPMIAESWRRNWEQLRPFLELPPALRKMVYTTNTVESLNFQLRKVIKTKGHFPSDEAAFKLLYLALRNVERNWHAKPAPDWKQTYAQLVNRFGARAEVKE